jgi:hypothetical protein
MKKSAASLSSELNVRVALLYRIHNCSGLGCQQVLGLNPMSFLTVPYEDRAYVEA